MKYEIKYTSDWEEAEQLSEEGWELVSVQSWLWIQGWSFMTYYYFKRPL